MYKELKKKLSIGNTPIIEFTEGIFLKLEQYNFGGSIKSRVALNMIKKSIQNNELKPFTNQTVLEASGGNTCIGVAILSKYFGYKLTLIIPDNYSKYKINFLKQLGANIKLSNHKLGNDSHVKLAREIYAKNQNYIYVDQLTNSANIDDHFNGTGKEILHQVSNIDAFVSVIGSSGTVSGVSKKIKEKFPNAKIFGVMPKGYSIVNCNFVPHTIEGASIGMMPPLFDKNLVDEYIDVSKEEVLDTAKKLMKKYGMFLGISSVANITASLKIQNRFKNIVTISPDAGYDYLDFYSKLGV